MNQTESINSLKNLASATNMNLFSWISATAAFTKSSPFWAEQVLQLKKKKKKFHGMSNRRSANQILFVHKNLIKYLKYTFDLEITFWLYAWCVKPHLVVFANPESV